MAVWQFSCNIVPLRQDAAKEALRYEDVISWEHTGCPTSSIDFLERVQNEAKDRIQYGNSEETCVEFFCNEKGDVQEIRCSLDLRSLTKQTLDDLVNYVKSIGGGFFAGGVIYPPDANTLASVIQQSEASLYCAQAQEFFAQADQPTGPNIPAAERVFKRLGFALFATSASTTVLQFLFAIVSIILLVPGSSATDSTWLFWVLAFAPLYLVGVPLGLWIMRKVPVEPGEPCKLGVKNFFIFMLMCFPLMYGGNLIGTALSALLSGGTAQNALYDLVFDTSPLKILFMVVLAPIVEEFLFRKQLIDRCSRYGEKNAILFSALLFGLFHMNLYQFFYAFGLGLVFAYVYIRTRRLRYSIFMHMIINFIGSVLSPLMLSLLDLELIGQIDSGRLTPEALLAVLPTFGAYLLYMLVLIGLSIAGLVLLIVKAPKLVYRPSAEELGQGQRLKTIYGNSGVITFILFCAVICALSLFQ